VGVETFACVAPNSWQIVKCVAFQHSPAGIVEKLITTALGDLYAEQRGIGEETPSLYVLAPGASTDNSAPDAPSPLAEQCNVRILVSFGISAAEHLSPGHNIGGWRVNVLSRTYKAVSGVVGLLKTTQFRVSFVFLL
jgi:hypothetical protein